jgi:predicted P-loop ATPase
VTSSGLKRCIASRRVSLGTSKRPSSRRWRPPEQAKRLFADVWEAPIREWLGDRTDVTVWEVLKHVLGLPKGKQTQAAQKRVVAILTSMRLGFTKHRPRMPKGRGQRRQNRYQRDDANFTKPGMTTGSHDRAGRNKP